MISRTTKRVQLDRLVHRVLLVEDDFATQANIRHILELDGYVVTCLGTAAETLLQGDLDEYTAVVLDRHLPDADANDLLPKLNRLAPNVPLVIVTGDADLNGTIIALRHGASDYILKPINADCLRASLDRVRQLRVAQHRAAEAERLAAIGEAVASVAHESRNDLQRIACRVELLKAIHSQDSQLLGDLRVIEAASQSLKCMFEELREFSAPIQLDLRGTRVRDLIYRAWEKIQCGTPSLAPSLSLKIDDCEVIGDTFRLEQVFRNLFENAIGASSETARIEVETRDAQFQGQDAIRIIVRDDGCGFTDEQRQNAFEPFFTTKPKGTGLGLAICKRIVELHGGHILIEPSAAKGAAVVVTLPMERKTAFVCEPKATTISTGQLVQL